MNYTLLRLINGLFWGVFIVGVILLISVGSWRGPIQYDLLYISIGLILLGYASIIYTKRKYKDIFNENYKPSKILKVSGFLLLVLGILYLLGKTLSILGVILTMISSPEGISMLAPLFAMVAPGVLLILAGIGLIRRPDSIDDLES